MLNKNDLNLQQNVYALCYTMDTKLMFEANKQVV